jgi:cytochrome c biogenesis protein CcmG/thiol:disulfide interchange protein DsbE
VTRFVIPLAVFIVLVGFLFVGLRLNPREVPSPLVDKPAPAFQLAQLHAPERSFGVADMKGKVWLLNVWASWCVSCREEHPFLMELAKQGSVPIVGLNYKDKPQDAMQWLTRFGNPYQLSVVDAEGRTGIDFGVYGVPETFLIDRDGVIRHKQIGPLTREVWQQTLLPLVKKLSA